jgi:hypothetical protein
MSQEAITEIDMDVFARRIGPYFTWLESRIESGWQQSDSVQKDILKEIKYLATTMRARFILGVSREDFTKEVHRAIELLTTAAEAFPGESDEIESKMGHFCKGISEELGPQFLPKEHQPNIPRPPQPLEPHPFPMPDPEPGPEPDGPEEPDEEKIKIEAPKVEKIKQKIAKAQPKIENAEPKVVNVAPKVEIAKKKVEAKIEKPKEAKKIDVKVKKVEREEKPVKTSKPKTSKKGKRKGFFLARWVKNFIYGED